MANRKPTAILQLTGALKRNPGRYKERASEPKDLDALGDPPKRLTAQQKEAWGEIVSNCPYGVLTVADRHSVEIVSVLLAEFWANGAETKGSNLSLLNTLLSKLGMNPSDRSRVTVPQTQKENPFSKNGRRFGND